MHVSIQKWGNSLALRIPQTVAQDLDLGRGAVVELTLKKKTLTLTPLPKRSWSLKRLLSGVSGYNLHGETNTGKTVGREAW